MRCPLCNSEITTTIDSRKKESLTRRRRKCLECNYRFSTVEIMCEDYDAMVSENATLRKCLKDVSGLLASCGTEA